MSKKIFTNEKKRRMEQLLKSGRSVYSIAKELKLTPSVARYHAKKLSNNASKNKKAPREGDTYKTLEEAIDAYVKHRIEMKKILSNLVSKIEKE